MCRDPKALEFVKYLFKDLLSNQFMLESVASRVVIEGELLDMAVPETKSFVRRETLSRPRRLSLEVLADVRKTAPAQSIDPSVRRSSFSYGEQSSASITRVKNRLAHLT